MAEKVGKIIIETGGKPKKKLGFEVYYLENAHKGYEELFNVYNPSYWVVCSIDEYNTHTINLGELMFEIRYLKSKGGKVIDFHFPEEIQDIANKEACFIGLSKNEI